MTELSSEVIEQVDQENKLFAKQANTYLSSMERWGLLHPVGLVYSTPWNMRWAREDWATVHQPSKLIGQVDYGGISVDLFMVATSLKHAWTEFPQKGSILILLW